MKDTGTDFALFYFICIVPCSISDCIEIGKIHVHGLNTLQIATLRSAQDEAFHRQMREQVELAEDAEVAKLMEARDRAMQQKAAQLQQLEDVKARILAERAANKVEVSLSPSVF